MMLNETASLRVEITQLERQAHDLMMKMSAGGVSEELLLAYERIDSRIILLRMQLLQDLRHILADRATSLYDQAP